MNWMEWMTLILLIGAFATGIYYYDKMPEYMATHWNQDSEVDGYMEKGAGLFLIPGMLLFLVLLFYVIPRIDPLKENIMKFEKYYLGMVFMLVLFLSYVYFLSIAWNMGYEFDMGRMIVPGIGVLLIYIGIMCGESRQNWFVGVRTPWTLSCDKVWERTHSKAKAIFIGLGALWIVAGLLFPSFILYLLVLLVLASLWLFVDSYLEYRKEMGAKKAEGPKAKVISPARRGVVQKAAVGRARKRKAGKKKGLVAKKRGKKK